MESHLDELGELALGTLFAEELLEAAHLGFGHAEVSEVFVLNVLQLRHVLHLKARTRRKI